MSFASLTPNLVVSDMARSIAFYRDVLGFAVQMHVPENEPFVFAGLQRDAVQVFLNALASVKEDYPGLVERPLGGSFTMFIVVGEVDALYAQVREKARVTMPIKTQFYGMREFAIEDPDAYVITFAQEVKG